MSNPIQKSKAVLSNVVKSFILFPRFLFITFSMILDRLKGKKIVVFDVSSAGFVQFILPFYEKLIQEKKQLAYYLALHYPMKDKVKVFNLSSFRCFPSKIAKYLFLTDMFIELEICCRGPKNAIKIMFGHGQPVKFSNWSENHLKAFDVFFLYGPLERELFEYIQNKKPESSRHIKLINIGYPKIDDLFQGKYKRDKILSDLGLDPTLPTVLYAPAWDPGGSLRTYGTKIVEKLLSIPNVNVIVKLHPVSLELPQSPYYKLYTGGVNWVNRFEPFEKYPNCCHVTDYLINPLLAASDIMVTDFSGVALEFMTQDCPVIFIDCPDFYEKTLKEWEQDDIVFSKQDERLNAGRNAGLVVKDLFELADAVKRCLNHPEEFSEKRKALSKRLLYNPGKGSEAAAKAILNLLGL